MDKWLPYCNLMIGVCLTGGAMATVLVPWCRAVQLLWCVVVVQGTFEGVINIGIVTIFELFASLVFL